MTRSTVAVLLSGMLLAIPAVPQQAPPKGQAAPQQPQATPQQPALPGRPTFTTTPTEVILPVTVTDNKGRFVSNLEKGDFQILDEGRPQKPTFFFHDTPGTRQNTVIGFLVDMSNTTLSHWDKFKEATKEMIWGLLPSDPNYTGYLISYSTEARRIVDTTSDPDKLTDQVDRMKPGGGAALYNAIYMACTDRTLVPGEPYQPRRVIIVIGDGHDTASDYTLDQVIELASRNQVTIYGVSTVAFAGYSEDSDNLERLAKETGGHVEYPLNNPYTDVSGYLSQPSDYGNYALTVGSGGYASAIAQAINKSVQSLQGEITTQYILRYIPDIDPATAYKDKRKIEVKIRLHDPQGRLVELPAGAMTVQARKSYYANPVRVSPGQ